METPHDLAKWLEGKMTESEKTAFEQSDDFKTYEKIRDYSAQLQPPVTHIDQMYRNVLSGKKSKSAITIKPNWFLRIAALLVVALGLFFALGPVNQTDEVAANGEQRAFVLPDASKVTLNSGSKATYHSWRWINNRCVELEGEAFFKVTKGSTFDVRTAVGTVTVMGTQFNVRARGQRFEVTCFEGKVKVSQHDRSLFLEPGERVIFENGKPVASPAVQDAQPSWMNYQLSFQAEKLTSVMAEMERQYAVKITLPPKGTDRSFTGVLPAANLDMALEIIASAYDMKFRRTEPDAITFYR